MNEPVPPLHRCKPSTIIRSLPCIQEWNPAEAKCEKCVFPTPEEIAAEEADMKQRFERMALVRAAIVKHLGGPWKRGTNGRAGSITCPCCNGNVNFSRAGINGHIHARCSTPDCAAWME